MDPTDLILSPAYSWYPGNIYGQMQNSQTYAPAPDPGPPPPPPPPRMGRRELDDAIGQVTAHFTSAANHIDDPSRVNAGEMKKQLGNVPEAGRKLLELALGDRGVMDALRAPVREGWFNARDVSMDDLNALDAGRKAPSAPTTLTRLRAAVRVDPSR